MFKKQIHRLLGPEGPVGMVWVHQLISGEETEAEMGISSPRSCGLGELSSLLSSSPPWLSTPTSIGKERKHPYEELPLVV